ncbi:hypothetical protein BD770DRAFT_374068, partial [Pilaira anomala]
MLYNSMDMIPTFQRSPTITSTIDYIHLGTLLKNRITENSIQYINPNWSDHALLGLTITLGTSKIGPDTTPGMWRGNPTYASNPKFKQNLEKKITKL